jgi:hypothetical protein
MELCPICLDEMDMKAFNDEKQSTSTCFRLECGHGFHTKCVIQTLQVSNSSCPSCHQFKTPRQLIQRDGILKKLLGELKRCPEISFTIAEFKEAKKESDETLKKIEKEVFEFVKERIAHHHFEEKRKYAVDAMNLTRRRIHALAREKGVMYIGALTSMSKWEARTTFQKKILGLQGSTWRCLRSIQFPTLRTQLYNMK